MKTFSRGEKVAGHLFHYASRGSFAEAKAARESGRNRYIPHNPSSFDARPPTAIMRSSSSRSITAQNHASAKDGNHERCEPVFRSVQGGILVLLGLLAVAAARPPPLPKATPVPERATLETGFEQQMKGVTLSGFFTVTGREDDNPLKEEKYTIEKVSKLKEGFWLFTARILRQARRDARDAARSVWAGDTPVITLTE